MTVTTELVMDAIQFVIKSLVGTAKESPAIALKNVEMVLLQSPNNAILEALVRALFTGAPPIVLWKMAGTVLLPCSSQVSALEFAVMVL
jgi:hypothetical protein